MTGAPGAALVTGASAGIGRAFAERLARDGHPLVLVARREERLRDLAASLGNRYGVTARVVVADLATPEGRAACRDGADAAGPLAVAVLNAGVGGAGTVATLGRERQVAMTALNCDAVVDLAAHVLPGMIERGAGAVIVVSSAAAWQPVPYAATYSATKAFELSFAQALDRELRGTGVRAIAVCPGPTSTEFFAASGIRHALPRVIRRETPEGVVAATFRALDRGRSWVPTGPVARLTTIAASLLPRALVVAAAGRIHRRVAGDVDR